MLTSAAAKWPSRHFHVHIKQEVPLTPPLPPLPPPPLHSSSFFSSPLFFLSLPPLFLPPSLPLAASFRLLPKEKSIYHDLCPRTCQRRSSRNILVKTLTLLGERLRIRWRTVVLVLKTSPGRETSFTDDFWKSLPVKLTAEETPGGGFFLLDSAHSDFSTLGFIKISFTNCIFLEEGSGSSRGTRCHRKCWQVSCWLNFSSQPEPQPEPE